jgi:protein-disulfide isomerase
MLSKAAMKILASLLLCFTAFAQTPTAPTLDKAKLEAYLRHLELWVPLVNVKIDDPKPVAGLPGMNQVIVHLSYNQAALDQSYYVSADGQKVIKGDVYDLSKSPFQANLDKLKFDGQPSFGGDNKAPVTLAVFADFQCPFCKEEANQLRTNLNTAFPGKVRTYFMDFPLDSIHPWAHTAAIAGRCILKQNGDAFWKYHDWIYEEQQGVTPENYNSKLMEWAGKNGLDAVQLGRCVDNKTTDTEVLKTQVMGRSLGVEGTPTVFLNGRKLMDQMAQWPTLQQLITLEIDHQAKVAAEAEKCCTVEIPKLGK